MTARAERINAIRSRAEQEVNSGAIPSCQFALARNGEIIAQETLGDAPADARYTIFSATKPLIASVVWQLIGEGAFHPLARVADVWPKFGAGGKDSVTLEHVLLHTAGLPSATLDRATLRDRAQRRGQMEAWAVEWEPGSRFVYHPSSAHWILAELIELATGLDYRVALRQRVLDPLELHRLELGVPEQRQGDIQSLRKTGTPPPIEEIMEALGVASLELPAAEIVDLMTFNDSDTRAVGIPGGGGISDAGNLALFYQALLHDSRGLWDREVLNDVTANIRNTFPALIAGQAARSRGLEIAGDGDGARYRVGCGVTSRSTFGHGGAAGQVAWADPATGLSFVFLTNGWDQNFIREYRRSADLCALAAACAAA